MTRWSYGHDVRGSYTGSFTIVETKRLGTNPGF